MSERQHTQHEGDHSLHSDGEMKYYLLLEKNLLEVRRRLDDIQQDVSVLKTDLAVMKAKGEGTNGVLGFVQTVLMAILVALLGGLFAVLARSVGH